MNLYSKFFEKPEPPQPVAPETILAPYDAGKSPAEIIATGIEKGTVYAVLREYRPDRKRAPRTRKSPYPGWIAALASEGMSVERIAHVLSVSKVYVYQNR